MNKFHKTLRIFASVIFATLIVGCGGGGTSGTTTSSTSTGTLALSMTDAPLKLGDDVTEVNIAVIGIEYNYEGNWTKAEDFAPQTFNLLELQNGKSLHLGDMVLPAGHYTEIRFILAAPTKESEVKSNPDCNITFSDGTSVPLFVPSGAQSGFKGKGDFDITANAKIAVTADFDVQKSIVVAGNSGKYLLKPVIRLVVTELSGMIQGTIVDINEYNATTESFVVYAYENGTYSTEEETPNSDGIVFGNSISSANVMSDGNFTLSYLEEGIYTLVTALYTNNELSGIVDSVDGIQVSTGTTTAVDINTSDNPL